MRLLFVGLGSIATKHIKDVSIIADKKNIKLEIVVLRQKISPLAEDISLLVSKQITEIDETKYDVVFITNPTILHFESLCKLKGRAKYYFIEKPIFEDTDKDLSLLDINEKNAYVAAPMRHMNVYKELKKLVEQNKVFNSRIICSSYLPEWRPNSDYRNIYSAKRELGGGVTLDLIHEIDYMIGLFGYPEKILNMRGKYSNLEINSDDLSVYIAKYESMLCEVHLDYFGRKYQRTCELYTEEGTFIADFGEESILYPDGTKKFYKCEISDIYSEMEYFMNYITGNVEDNVNSPIRGLKVLKYALGEVK